MKRRVNNASNLVEILQKSKIVIYGAGYVAERFYKALKERQIAQNVVCFAITKGEKGTFCDLPVVLIDDLDNKEDVVICIAVHEAIKDDIISVLEDRELYDYIWIYPFQYQLMLGEPIKKSVKVPMADIILKGNECYGFAVRYLAIEQFYHKNEIGYEIYVKAWSASCGEKTAKARLQKLIALIENWELHGYDESMPSSILEDNEVIDGTHRIMLAAYKKMEYIVCDVYQKPNEQFNVHTDDAKMTRESLERAGFTQEEFEEVETIRRRINEQYLKC